MKPVILFLLLLSFQSLLSQKVVRKTVALPAGSVLIIDAMQCSAVWLETHAGNELLVEARMEGEYAEDNLLQLGKQGTTTTVKAGIQPLFCLPGDKLGAHKVVSISLKVSLPENCIIKLYSRQAQVAAGGVYKDLYIALNDGTCLLQAPVHSVAVVTRNANILLESPGATILAESRYGTISPNAIPSGNTNTQISLKSISGSIKLIRTE